MMSMQLSALLTAIVGWVASIIICALPMWRMTSFLGSNTMAAQSYSEGLWVTCTTEGTGQLQCRHYNSLLEITPDLIVARVSLVISLITSFTGLIFALLDRDITNCMAGISRNRYTAVAGTCFILAGVLVLVPVSWVANNIVNNFYTPMVPEAISRELGAALYIGWISTALLIVGGVVLCRLGTQFQQDSYLKNYRAVKTCGPASYPMKDYV